MSGGAVGITRIMMWLAVLGCGGCLGGCTVYHAAPLPAASDFVASPSATQPLTPARVAALALQHDPVLVAARMQHGLAAAELLAAGLPPDPVISGDFAALLSGPGAMPSISAALSQDVSALLTYSVNRRAAKSGLAQVDAGVLWQEWQVAAQAEQLCVTLRADDATLVSLRADDAALIQLADSMQVQIKQGNLTLADQTSVQAALANVQGALNAATATTAQDQDQLDALLNLAPGTILSLAAAPLPAISAREAKAALASLTKRRPDLIALRYGYEQADAKLRAAILNQFLPVSLGASGGRDTSGVVGVGPQISLTLPLFSRNRPAIAAAGAARAALRAQYQASLDGAVSGVLSLRATILTLRTEAAQADMAAQTAQQAAAQARAAYTVGALDARAETDLIIAAGERIRAATALHDQLDTATLSLATLAGIGLPPVTEPQT
ncbi:MAG: hypothetical protein B7Z81_01850 [Acidocella sp. 20-61-6]|nr:MAG: hypothetical protein B7Z81_01850 [Acidocella sp. 20-61-6]